MAGFKFRLDFMIKIRQRKEEEAMSRLARRLASIRELEEEIAELTARKAELAADLDEKIKTGQVTIGLLQLYKEYERKLSGDIARDREFLFLSRREEAKERAALTKAAVDRKVMEKLKEKKKAEFEAERMYIEQNNMEEMASLARARRERTEGRAIAGGLDEERQS